MSETPPPTPLKPRSGRLIKVALAISVAFNLLIVGLVGGAFLGRKGPDEMPAIRALGLGPFTFALPREGRSDMRSRIESDAETFRGHRRDIGRSLVAVRLALLAEPFDRAAAERALARSREAALALHALGHGALIDTLDEMSSAERIAVADRLERALRRLARQGPGAPRP